MDNNSIFKLPESICDLHSLRRTSLKENKIEQLPENIGELKFLRVLDISEINY